MEALAVDRLIEKAHFHSDVALAIAEAIDITIRAGNFVTVPMLDARFAEFEAKIEVRFAAIEKSISSLKVWMATLYPALIIAGFSGLALDNHWLVSREDQAIAQMEARSDQRFQQVDQRFQRVDQRFQQIDEHFQQIDEHFQRVDEHLQQIDQHFQQVDARFDHMDAELKEIRALVSGPRGHRSPVLSSSPVRSP